MPNYFNEQHQEYSWSSSNSWWKMHPRLPPLPPSLEKTSNHNWNMYSLLLFWLPYWFLFLSILMIYKTLQEWWPRTLLNIPINSDQELHWWKKKVNIRKCMCRISHLLWGHCASWTEIRLMSILKTNMYPVWLEYIDWLSHFSSFRSQTSIRFVASH